MRKTIDDNFHMLIKDGIVMVYRSSTNKRLKTYYPRGRFPYVYMYQKRRYLDKLIQNTDLDTDTIQALLIEMRIYKDPLPPARNLWVKNKESKDELRKRLERYKASYYGI
jgi:hypothetical protein